MAIRIDVQDLENWPGNVKTITIDQDQIVPTGFEGDEQFVLSFSTTAYSDNVARTAIPDLYIMKMKAGWCKSSGLTGSSGKFKLDSDHCKLKVQLDTMTSGVEIELYQDGTFLTGEAVAENMEEEIRGKANVVDAGFKIAYRNSSVEFKNGKFWIVSGSIGGHYTGSHKSAVKVLAADSNSCWRTLGFDLAVDSETMAGITTKEAALVVDYTAGGEEITIGAGTGVTNADCLMITDGTNTDYFSVISVVADSVLTIAATDIIHSYTTVSGEYGGAKVQILREQDPEGTPTAWYTNIDSITRLGIKSILTQIDFSS